ncbi:LPD1 domain-containing protein (plasmid) [Xanthomonas sontii]|uniref:LPD1 domain-containing protein n=1 Tax=Xanthomonas sontii TaxID=2650745 RepID=UPI003F87328A
MVLYENIRRVPVGARADERGLDDAFWTSNYTRGVQFLRTCWEDRSFTTLPALAEAFRHHMSEGAESALERSYATAALAKGRVVPSAMPTDLPPYLEMRRASLSAMGWPDNMDIPDDARVGVFKVAERDFVNGYEPGYYPGLAVHGSNRVVPLKHEPFVTRRAAVRAAVEEQKEFNLRSLVRGGTPTLQYRRVGFDWRAGESVSEAVLQSMFDFKCLEFGKTISASEQQTFIEALCDASFDLCSVLGASYWAASCFGRLGIAFGSQGRGAATGAAHFDAETWVMHLTKTRGGGALCHEYGHAFDAMLLELFFDKAKLPAGMLYLSDLMAMMHDTTGTYTMRDALLPLLKQQQASKILEPIDDLFENIFSRRREDSFFTRSEMVDLKQGVVYWAMPRELFARAFETFALDRLSAAGTTNDFLVRHVDEYIRDGEPLRASVFPQGYQRQELARQFDALNEQLNYLELWRT